MIAVRREPTGVSRVKDRRLSRSNVRRRRSQPIFDLASLERRVFMAVTPSSVLTKGMREVLLSKWNGSNKAELSTLLKQGKLSTFDSRLLSYMRNRDEAQSLAKFYFKASDADDIGTYVKDNIGTGQSVNHANNVLANRFPQQDSATVYDVQLGSGDIDFKNEPSGIDNPEFMHSLNRHTFWLELANAYRYTGDDKYVTEITEQLASWSKQYPAVSNPDSVSSSAWGWQLLDTSVRTEMWVWTYYEALTSSKWDGAANTLFLYKMAEHGEHLSKATPSPLTSNRTISHAKGLIYTGEMFPEFSKAGDWADEGRDLLFAAMDANFYSDGVQFEQSPGYANDVIEDVLDIRQLDKKNGVSWPSEQISLLGKTIDSYWETLNPDGTTPAIGDTLRTRAPGVFFKGNLVLDTTKYPMPKPSNRSPWLFGVSTVSPFSGNSNNPALGDRGRTAALTASGNYVMRSGDDADARQVIFDAGPKGGDSHGHNDYLNFELFGYDRPLISDPGPYKYDSGNADRQYVISTKAHNTLNSDGANTGSLEGENNPGLIVSQWATDNSTYAQVTATHRAYANQAGSPVLTRSMWYDLNGTIVIVDWAEATASHKFQQSFNLQTEGDTNNVTTDTDTFMARTRYPDGGNVKIQGLTRPGQTATKGGLTFVTNLASGDYKDDAYRFTVQQTGTFVCFVTLITAYEGTSAPDTTATLLNTPKAGQPVQVQVNINGSAKTLTFTPPALTRLNSLATNKGDHNDIVYDSKGRLHMVYVDRDDKGVKYAVRETDGKWTIPQTIAKASGPKAKKGYGNYAYPSLAVDKNGNPAVAFYEGKRQELRFAQLVSGAWQMETVAHKDNVGEYPSLAFSRNNGAVMSYYDRTNGDLKLAMDSSNGWQSVTIDSKGDVGRNTDLTLDPNRSTSSKWAISYVDASNGRVKYAIQGKFGGGTQVGEYTNYTADDLNKTPKDTSIAFYDSGSKDTKRWKPIISYYSSDAQDLRVAKNTDGGSSWTKSTVASKNDVGQFSQIFVDAKNKPTVYYYDKTAGKLLKSVLDGTKWSQSTIATGGRNVRIARNSSGRVSYTLLDDKDQNMDVIV